MPGIKESNQLASKRGHKIAQENGDNLLESAIY